MLVTISVRKTVLSVIRDLTCITLHSYSAKFVAVNSNGGLHTQTIAVTMNDKPLYRKVSVRKNSNIFASTYIVSLQ
jgi:ABC-type Na+ transport system ATPase subunit NatA